jgi:preprotein translocase subunit SecF
MKTPLQPLKKKVILSFSVIIALILCSSALGWEITQQIEKTGTTTETVHLFKEAELQLRREEKNLLIRGYSLERFHRWQKAKEDFYQRLGELIGLKALDDNEITELKSGNSAISDAYTKFFDDIKSGKLTEAEAAQYDSEFRQIGQRSLQLIDGVLAREHAISRDMDSRADLLIIFFSVVFVGTTSFLVINVLRDL